MKVTKGKKITIDELAAMMQKNFLATDKNMAEGFQKVNDRLDKVDGRLDKVDVRLEAIEQEIVNVRGLPHRVKKLESALEIE